MFFVLQFAFFHGSRNRRADVDFFTMKCTVAVATAAAAVVLRCGGAAAQDPKLPTFTTWWATVNSTAVPVGGLKEHSKGVAAWQVDDTANRTAWISDRAPFVADFDAGIVSPPDASLAESSTLKSGLHVVTVLAGFHCLVGSSPRRVFPLQTAARAR
jgi:hypothetical protein